MNPSCDMIENGTKKEVGFGIVGCGVIMEWHAAAIKAANGGRLVGITDVNVERARSVAEQYGVKAYATVEELLTDDAIDAVCICTPSGFHASIAMKVIKAGKNVMIEKPLAIKTEDCKALIAAAKESGVCASVISQNRFTDTIQELRRIVQEGRLGKIITVDLLMKFFRSQEYYDSSNWRGTWALDGGSLMNQGIHGVDFMIYVLGNVKSVYAYARTLAHDMEAEDTACAVVEFENGALGVIQSTTAIYEGLPRSLTIAGTKGTITVKGDEIENVNIADYEVALKVGSRAHEKSFAHPTHIGYEGHTFQIQDFIDAIREGRDPLVTLEDASRAVAFINAVYESSRTGKQVFLN